MKKRSIKNIRINAEVQRELGNIIRNEVKDPRISPMTTVVTAEVTPDLKYCKAYISVLGSKEAAENTMKGLNSAVGYIRKALAKSVNLRNTPEITFVLDQSIEYGVRMSKLIDDVMAEIPSEESEEAEAMEAFEDEDECEDEEDEAEDEEDGSY